MPFFFYLHHLPVPTQSLLQTQAGQSMLGTEKDSALSMLYPAVTVKRWAEWKPAGLKDRVEREQSSCLLSLEEVISTASFLQHGSCHCLQQPSWRKKEKAAALILPLLASSEKE